MHQVDFLAFLKCTQLCLLPACSPGNQAPSEKGSTVKGKKKMLSLGANSFPFGVDPFLENRQNQFDGATPQKEYPFHINGPYQVIQGLAACSESLDSLCHAMQKFWHMWTMKAQISLRVCAI